ncbi:MAG: UDP-N-acetylmuramoyl-L-alanyl-D-glutamate--2,6-diaminopimelate ligase [Treponema sp.]|jgi:UDP-N-acetylmuramoyl-L-alanyl-D-glutamate--2,6-diaminopimelate ligase|nr:UDP-N-acetylmuramoyl-L-alanyl-D-glutamate--2,6-diaminopimelate ligase [Treponema sp.]
MEQCLSQFFTKEIEEKAEAVADNREGDPLVTSLEYDSRNVKEGSLFFALPGLHTDGSLYIDDAVKKGAVVIVHENEVTEKKENVVYIKVKNARVAMSPISAAFYGFPSKKLLVTGVTGTEGKSTTVYFIWQLLTLMGKKAGFISTVQHCLGGDVLWNSEHQTTPEAPVVQRLLREMADNGCEFAVLEASSHGLSQKTNRLGDVNFCAGVVTNVAHEHLEFHGTWEKYRDDKANLFRSVNNYEPLEDSSFTEPFGVVNADDKSAQYFIKTLNHRTYTYSPAGRVGDLIIEAIESGTWGNWYMVSITEQKKRVMLRDKLPGAFNSANVLASLLAVSGLLELPVDEIAPHVKRLKPVRGRMTAIIKNQPFEVVVDYAHTPSSFQTIFPPLRARLDKTGGRIISVFGSAGERDTQKRAEQGKIAAHYSDIIVLTDEDPRGEKPSAILEEISKGVFTDQGLRVVKAAIHPDVRIDQNRAFFDYNKNIFLIPDRPAAIRKALSLAQEGDLVLLLGKGHENSIIYADHVKPYDEIEEVEKALGEMGW